MYTSSFFGGKTTFIFVALILVPRVVLVKLVHKFVAVMCQWPEILRLWGNKTVAKLANNGNSPHVGKESYSYQ